MTQVDERMQRQSAVQIIFILASTLRRSWIIFLIPLSRLFRDGDKASPEKINSLQGVLITIAVFIVMYALLSVAQYFMFRFAFTNNMLLIRKGLGVKKSLNIPRSSIQGLQLHQNLLHRITHTYKVAIDSAGTKDAEAELGAVSEQTVRSLEAWVAGTTHQKEVNAVKEAVEPVSAYKLSGKDFFRLWVSENHFKTLSLIAAFLMARFYDVAEWLGYTPEQYLRQQTTAVQWTTTLLAVLAVVGIVAALVVSGVRVLVQYINYRVELREKQFMLTWGLVSTQKVQVPFTKIQSINWQANWLRRKLDLWLVKLQTLNNLEEKEFKQKAFPVAGQKHIPTLTNALISEWPCAIQDAQQVSKKMINRYWLLYGLLPALLAGAIAWYWLQAWALLAMLYAVYQRWEVVQQYNNLRWCTNGASLMIQKGIWGRQYWLIDFEKVQTAWCTTGPWMRKHSLSTLHVYTGAATVSIPLLHSHDAEQLLHACMSVSSFGKRVIM